MEPIDIGTVAGSVTAFYIALSAILKKIGYISLQNPKKNGNGNGNGNKYDPKYCRGMHKDIDINLKGLQDDCKSFGEWRDKGDGKFTTIDDKLGTIQTNVGILLDRSKNRRAGD